MSLDVALCTDGPAGAQPRELGAGHAGDSRSTAQRETPGTQSACGGPRGSASGP
jgi:hypothetical protein